MRWLRCLLLAGLAIAWAVAAQAAGFAYGKSFAALQETEQTAVICMERGAVTVDLFITLGGLPAGETATYVLPFWYQPEAFRAEGMAAETFRTRYVQPAFEQLSWNNQLAYGEAKPVVQDNLAGASGFFLGLAAPTIFEHIFGSTWRDPLNSAQRNLLANTRSQTSSTVVKLIRISRADIPALAAQSGMPERYARTLSRYQAPYAAVIQVTGTGQGGWGLRDYGMHFHFRHRLQKDALAYTYPLRTGAAWARPGMLTEIYAVCPPGYVLNMANPTDGISINYPWFNTLVEDAMCNPRLKLLQSVNRIFEYEHRPTATSVPSLRASQLYRDCTRPSARHVAYFNTSIGSDVHFTLASRPHAWRTRLAFALLKQDAANRVAFGTVIPAWVIAILLVLVPWWRRTRDGSLVVHMLVAFFWPMGMLTLGMLAAMLCFWPGIIIFGLVLYLVARRKTAQPAKYLLHPRVLTWLLATALYLLFSAGWIFLAQWAEAGVRG